MALSGTAGYNRRMAKPSAIPVPYIQPYRYPSPNIPLAAIRRFALRIAKRFQPRKIILFGSYAYGKPHAESDVDLLVTFRRPAGYFALVALQQYLESVLGRNVDIVTPGGLKPAMRDQVLAEAIDVN